MPRINQAAGRDRRWFCVLFVFTGVYVRLAEFLHLLESCIKAHTYLVDY